MVRSLRERGIRDERVLRAMASVPRESFVPESHRAWAYDDSALPIGLEQTISQPYMVALMLELLDVRPEHSVLEVGAGSGYQAALLAALGREVWAVEIIEALAERARRTLAEAGCPNVVIVTGDGSGGYPEAAPFDRIIVAAGAPAVPEPLVKQLTDGGRLVIPVGDRASQRCIALVRHSDSVTVAKSIGCLFVPLVGEHGWPAQ
jgi:protein-L-isoaspartate(D-aspartate) O-methyltransferase